MGILFLPTGWGGMIPIFTPSHDDEEEKEEEIKSVMDNRTEFEKIRDAELQTKDRKRSDVIGAIAFIQWLVFITLFVISIKFEWDENLVKLIILGGIISFVVGMFCVFTED